MLEISREVLKRFICFLETEASLSTQEPQRSVFCLYLKIYFCLLLYSLSALLTLCLCLQSMKSCIWISTRNIPAVYPPYFFQDKKRSCLSGEYKQYVPVWILITFLSEKGYRNFPFGRMPWRFFFLLPSKFFTDVPLWALQLQFPLEVHLA